MRTFMRWTGIVVLALVALIVLGYVAKGVIGSIQVAGATDDARETVRQLERDTGDVDRQVADNRTTLGAPLRSWSQVVCELGSHDSGWIVNSYVQECSLEQVDVYPADDLDRAEALEDVDRRVSVEDWSEEPDRPGPLPALGAYTGFGSTSATPPVWDVRGDVADEDYTVVTVSGPRAETDLGCDPWGVPFCGEPVDRPAMPE